MTFEISCGAPVQARPLPLVDRERGHVVLALNDRLVVLLKVARVDLPWPVDRGHHFVLAPLHERGTIGLMKDSRLDPDRSQFVEAPPVESKPLRAQKDRDILRSYVSHGFVSSNYYGSLERKATRAWSSGPAPGASVGSSGRVSRGRPALLGLEATLRGGRAEILLDLLRQSGTLAVLVDQPQDLGDPSDGLGRPLDPDPPVLADGHVGTGVTRDRLDHGAVPADDAGDARGRDPNDRAALELPEALADHRDPDAARRFQVLDTDDHRVADVQVVAGLPHVDLPGGAGHVEGGPPGRPDLQKPERGLDVHDGPDDHVPGLRYVAARERNDVDERRSLGDHAKEAGVDLAADPVRARPGLQALAGDLVPGEN